MEENKYRCLIIDDDPLITDLIKHFCSKISTISYCISSNNAIDGLQLINNQPFDILFLDYNMPDLDGKSILELKQDGSKVIMITSNPEFAVASYEYDSIIDYLLKPISFDRFYAAVQKIEGMSPAQKGVLPKDVYMVKDASKWMKIKLDEVLFIASDSNYVTWHLETKQMVTLTKLKDLESDLPSNFQRIHRSYIVNLHCVDTFSKEEVTIGKVHLPIGQKYRESIDRFIERFKSKP